MSKTISQAEYDFLDHSNRIEGVFDGDSLGDAIGAWGFLKTKKKLTTGVVLKVHKFLMLHQPLYPNERGYFRRRPVFIGGKEAMKPSVVEQAMEGWLYKVNENLKMGPLGELSRDKIKDAETIKNHHIEYEKIHPFIDGNGRTGRMFMNWERIQAGLDILIIHEGEEQYNYYEWFK